MDGMRFEIECYIRAMKAVIRKKFFDQIALVTQADDEIRDTLGIEDFHDVPENRRAPDFDQRLRTKRGFFSKPRSASSSEYNRLPDHPVLMNLFNLT